MIFLIHGPFVNNGFTAMAGCGRVVGLGLSKEYEGRYHHRNEWQMELQ